MLSPVAQSSFPHRMNNDGTIDAICPRCYATIGTSTLEADLERIEAAHTCEPARLSYFDEQRRKPVAREAATPRSTLRIAKSRPQSDSRALRT